MHKQLLSGLLLAAVSIGSAAAAELQPGDWPLPPLPGLPAGGPDGPEAPGHERNLHFMLPGPAQEVIHTALEIEHLYREQGKPREVVALYQDLLAKAKDPMVRSFAFEALARAQQQPADTDKAIATLKQSLDESLQRLEQAPPPHAGEGPGKPHE